MPLTYGPYTFDAQNDADCQAFTFASTNGQTTAGVIDAAGTAAKFCHDTNGGNSASVGPDQGQGGAGDGYLYTETSSPGANADEYTMVFDTALDASSYQWQVNFYTCQRGPAIGNNQSLCKVQINEGGAGWVDVSAELGGSGNDTTDGTAWTSQSIDLSQAGVNVHAVTQFRIRIETQGPTSIWHGDYGIDTVEIVGTELSGIVSATPNELDMDTASVTLTGSNFQAAQTTATVYISDVATLAGGPNEVDITSAINTWSDTSVNLNLTSLTAGELASLQTLGPGSRHIIMLTSAADEYSIPITLHRPIAFAMSLSANFAPGVTTSRLTGLTGTFAGGRIEEALNPSTTDTDVAADGNREDVWCTQATSKARSVLYDFRVLYGGNVADTITQTPQVTIVSGTAYNKSLASSLSGNGVSIKSTERVLASSFTMSSTIVRKTMAILQSSLTLSNTLNRKISRLLSSSLSAIGVSGKTRLITLVGALTSVGTLTQRLVFLRGIAGSITATGVIARKISRPLNASIVALGALFKRAPVNLSSSIIVTGVLAKKMARLMTSALTTAGDITSNFKSFITLAGSITISGIANGVVVIVTVLTYHVKRLFYKMLGRR